MLLPEYEITAAGCARDSTSRSLAVVTAPLADLLIATQMKVLELIEKDLGAAAAAFDNLISTTIPSFNKAMGGKVAKIWIVIRCSLFASRSWLLAPGSCSGLRAPGERE